MNVGHMKEGSVPLRRWKQGVKEGRLDATWRVRKWANACRLDPSRKRGRRNMGMDGEVDKVWNMQMEWQKWNKGVKKVGKCM